MSYRIPSEGEISKAIGNVLVRNPHIHSQTELCRLVVEELKGMNGDYRAGAERIRRVGIRRGLFTVSISYSASSVTGTGEKCPVCREKLKSVRNMTLDGGMVELMRKCPQCGYAVRGNMGRPARYSVNRRF